MIGHLSEVDSRDRWIANTPTDWPKAEKQNVYRLSTLCTAQGCRGLYSCPSADAPVWWACCLESSPPLLRAPAGMSCCFLSLGF